jgi:ubiquinone/menaquinone biosynthesis C-methylase UbiE
MSENLTASVHGAKTMTRTKEILRQRAYYAETAARYDSMHVRTHDEHFVALSWLSGVIAHYQLSSVLDIGSGTGRALSYLKARHPETRVIGIEPSDALRKIAYQQGSSETELIEGDASCLSFSAKSFDVVCEFGVLHHIREPHVAVAEMLRVARRMVFISDDNHFAAGSLAAVKRGLNSMGLWKLAYWLKTAGKGYRESAEDGISYPYSVFESWNLLKAHSNVIHLMNTSPGEGDLYRSASHVALLAILKAD